jgi:hypothetical protein
MEEGLSENVNVHIVGAVFDPERIKELERAISKAASTGAMRLCASSNMTVTVPRIEGEEMAQVTQFVNPVLDSRQWRSFKVGAANVRHCVRSGQYLCDCRLFKIMQDLPIAGGVPGNELNFCGHIRAVIQMEAPSLTVVGIKAAPLPPKQTLEELAKRVPFQGGFGRRKFREE